MTHEIRVLPGEPIIEIRQTGHIAIKDVDCARSDAVPLVQSTGIRRILTDMRDSEVSVSTLDVFRFFSSNRDTLGCGTRVATVYSPGAVSQEDIEFAEDVSSNRGVPQRFFTQRDAAIKWLLNGNGHHDD